MRLVCMTDATPQLCYLGRVRPGPGFVPAWRETGHALDEYSSNMISFPGVSAWYSSAIHSITWHVASIVASLVRLSVGCVPPSMAQHGSLVRVVSGPPATTPAGAAHPRLRGNQPSLERDCGGYFARAWRLLCVMGGLRWRGGRASSRLILRRRRFGWWMRYAGTSGLGRRCTGTRWTMVSGMRGCIGGR